MRRRDFMQLLAAGSGALALAGSGCKKRADVTIGSKNFQEQWILASLVATLVERETRRSARTKDLGGTSLCHQALLSGDIDGYIEYTGTAFTNVLDREPVRDPDDVLRAVRQAYAQRFDVLVLPPLGFENTFAVLVRAADARVHGLRTLSDLKTVAGDLEIGMGFEFYDRADGYPGMVAGYDLRFAAVKQMKLGLVYRALAAGEIGVAVGNSTDGQIRALDLVVLEDDRGYFPPYQAVPLLRADTSQKFPAVRAALESLAGAISADEMRRANYAVDGEKKSPKSAAQALLARL